MDWKLIKDAGQTFGWWAVAFLAALYVLHKGWLSLGREVANRDAQLSYEREEHAKQLAEKNKRIEALESENRGLMMVTRANNSQVTELVDYLKSARPSRQDPT